ncbi:MAG: dethiobiotin synthase [Planctomycetota bacterium]
MPSPTVTFFTGTDTDVGKTHCAVMDVLTRVRRRRRVGVCKPVASGCRRDGEQLIADDAVQLWDAAGRPRTLDDVCTQRFEPALSPPMAASLDGCHVDESQLIDSIAGWLRDDSIEDLIIEGAGGLFSPMSTSWLNIDLIERVRELASHTSVVLVARNQIGVQHQVISAVRAAKASGCPIDTVWLNTIPGRSDPSQTSNADELRRWIDVDVISGVEDSLP